MCLAPIQCFLNFATICAKGARSSGLSRALKLAVTERSMRGTVMPKRHAQHLKRHFNCFLWQTQRPQLSVPQANCQQQSSCQPCGQHQIQPRPLVRTAPHLPRLILSLAVIAAEVNCLARCFVIKQFQVFDAGHFLLCCIWYFVAVNNLRRL